jgi:hypothetical protein
MQDQPDNDQSHYLDQIVFCASTAGSVFLTFGTAYYAVIGDIAASLVCGSAVACGTTLSVAYRVSFWGKCSKSCESSGDVSQMVTDRTQIMKWNG